MCDDEALLQRRVPVGRNQSPRAFALQGGRQHQRQRHDAQFVDSGAAEAGIVALSLVLSPALQGKGTWTLIPADWHAPLEQGYVILARARDNTLAHAFAAYIATGSARAVMRRYGFVLPGEAEK